MDRPHCIHNSNNSIIKDIRVVLRFLGITRVIPFVYDINIDKISDMMKKKFNKFQIGS